MTAFSNLAIGIHHTYQRNEGEEDVDFHYMEVCVLFLQENPS